ncbi:Hypothetical predicted protein [Octopus vulgaris]|uniref:DRBM domain-containing protein n=2 Tax=Octopus vulgaris TaxID=6645 RepID=A0AA36AEX3_OCTVU|nr:Hypothetical predicted protein [Octopus vulgaris]
MYKAKMFQRGFQMPKMSLGQHQNYPKTNSNLRMHITNLKSNKKFKKKSDDILMDIIKEAKDMRSSFLQSRNDGMKRPLDTRIVRSSYNLPPENKYFKNEHRDSLYASDRLNEKYSYPVEYPPMKRDSSEANSNLEMASLRVSLRKLQHYLSDKEFTYNSAIMCLDRALHATHCTFFLDYNVRKGYIEKEGILKLGSLAIGFGKSVSEEETQKLAYIDALRSLKYKRIEEILNSSDCNETKYYQEPNKPAILLIKNKSISELVIIESDLFASDRFKFSVSILHNSVVANKMKIKWDHAVELGTHKMSVYVQEKLVGTGRGTTKPDAKKHAACDALFKYFYKNNVILQVASEVESEICIPYSNVMYLVGEVKRRRNSYSGDEYADDGPFATVIENLIDSYSWSVLNNELLFGPGFFGDQVVLIKKIGEKKNLLMRKKRYKDGHYFSLHTGEDYSDIVKYLLKNGGRGGKYRIVPKSDIPELKSAKWQYYQKGVNTSNQMTGNMNEMSDYYRNYNDGNFVRRDDQLSHSENVRKNLSDSCTNMSQDPYDYKGYNYGKHSDNKRDYDRHFSNPNFSKSSVNLVESKQISNMGAKHINSNSSYYDRRYVPDDYEREINVCNRINSDANHNERGLYSHNQRSSMNDDGRYNSMDDQDNSFHHSKPGYSQRSYDLDCNPARDRMLSTDTNTYDSRYFRKNFDSATDEKMDDFTYSCNNRGFDLTESNDNYHSRTVYEYDNVQNRAGFNPSSMYNSRDITAAPKEHTGFNQEYGAGNPVPNYDREFSRLPDQYNKPYMYASGNEKNFQMERREEMFDRDFHPMSGRKFNETPSFQNKPIRQNSLDMSFNQIDNKNVNVNRMDLAHGFGNTYGNVKRNSGNNAYNRELNLRETARNIGNIRSVGKDVPKPWLPTNNKLAGNLSMTAIQTLNVQRLGLSKLSNRISSSLMNMTQSPNNNQIMLLKFLTKKIAQNALQNNVKNILANAKRLSNIAKARQMMEQAKKPFNVQKKPNLKNKSKKAKAVQPPRNQATPKQAALKQAAPKQTSNTPKVTKVKQASVPPKKVKK